MDRDPSPKSRAAGDQSSTGTARGDKRTLAAATAVLEGASGAPWYRRLLPFMGPAFIASVAYVDPGTSPRISRAAPSMAICSSG